MIRQGISKGGIQGSLEMVDQVFSHISNRIGSWTVRSAYKRTTSNSENWEGKEFDLQISSSIQHDRLSVKMFLFGRHCFKCACSELRLWDLPSPLKHKDAILHRYLTANRAMHSYIFFIRTIRYKVHSLGAIRPSNCWKMHAKTNIALLHVTTALAGAQFYS